MTEFVPVDDMTPEEALKDYEANASPELLSDVEKMINMGVNDTLRLLLFMQINLTATVKDIIEALEETAEQAQEDHVSVAKKDMN